MKMTRNHFSTSFSNSCVRVPVNPYSQQPSPSYERISAVSSPEDKGVSSSGKEQGCPISASSRAASSSRGNITKDGILHSKQIGSYLDKKSPFDSFIDFYESIPDYQEVTHLSDSEFADKMKLLRERQRQYLSNLGDKYNAEECADYSRDDLSFNKKKSYKLELAKEWVNKSCESLSSLGKKSENDYRLRETEDDTPTIRAQSAVANSQRKYSQYSAKDETDNFLMDTGSSLSTESNALKLRGSRPPCARQFIESSNATLLRDNENTIGVSSRLDSCNKGLSNFYTMKESNVRTSSATLCRKNRPSSCGLQSSGTSEINTLDCISPSEGIHNDNLLGFEEYDMPPGWLKSDSESVLGTGTLRNTSARRSHTQASRSLPGSPILKRVSAFGHCSSDSEKKKRKKKRRATRSRSKSPTKPVPFSFMRNENKHYFSRSTPDLMTRCRSPSPKLFRAKPIPRNLFSNYVYQKREEDEFFRALKRKVRAEEMLRAASLPPSMEFRERLSRVQAEAAVQAAVGSGGSHSSGPEPSPGSPTPSPPSRSRRKNRARRPPDFAKCHEKLRQELRDRQSRNITTSPSPYSLRTASLSPRRKLQDGCSSPGSGSRCRPRSSLNMSATSRSNLAALLRIQTARQRLEAEHRRLREEQVRRAELRLKARLTRLTPAWRSIQYSTEEDLALRAAVRREEERARREEHGLLMRHMLHRVHTIPTLFERQSAQAPPYAYPPSTPRFRPHRRSRVRTEECGPSCDGLDDLDEDASDVRGYARTRSRSRPNKRPSSCGPSGPSASRTGRSSRPGSSRVCLDPPNGAGRDERDDYDGVDEEEEVEEEVEDLEDEEVERQLERERTASP